MLLNSCFLGPFKNIQTPCRTLSAQLALESCVVTSHIGLAEHVRTGQHVLAFRATD